eukprot:gene41347-51197_t
MSLNPQVWMTYDKPSIQKGSYDGLADIYINGMWVGIGDYETQTFDLVTYRQEDAIVYTDVTTPSITGQPYFEHVAYVDKHPQPTHDGVNGSLPTGILDFW